MIKISSMNRDMIDMAADFIEKQNNIKSKYIGYCGTEFEEIRYSLLNDFSDLPLEESMVLAFDDNRLVGVLGFDIDTNANCIEVWGPFVEHEEWIDAAQKLWLSASERIPDEIKDIKMFIDLENKNCIEFAEMMNLKRMSIEKIMEFKREDAACLEPIEFEELTPPFYDDMKKLHDRTFQKTYYPGETIANRINKNRRVFVVAEGSSLLGYIYIEVEPEFGEGIIHYIAVREDIRGKGIGSKLLSMALKWAFSFETIESIELCVNGKNIAEKLYERIGFNTKNTLVYYRQ